MQKIQGSLLKVLEEQQEAWVDPLPGILFPLQRLNSQQVLPQFEYFARKPALNSIERLLFKISGAPDD